MATKKLVSHKGTLLGTITYPDEWEDHRQRSPQKSIRLSMWRPLSLSEYLNSDPLHLETVPIMVIEKAFSRQYPDAVRLYGVTPEEFEQQPDCSFAPGAGYIRSLIGKD